MIISTCQISVGQPEGKRSIDREVVAKSNQKGGAWMKTPPGGRRPLDLVKDIVSILYLIAKFVRLFI